jgi:ribosomal protein L40E
MRIGGLQSQSEQELPNQPMMTAETDQKKDEDEKKEDLECKKCGWYNPVDSKFCNRCGSSLSAVCPNCGNKNPSDASFCNECGTKISKVNA